MNTSVGIIDHAGPHHLLHGRKKGPLGLSMHSPAIMGGKAAGGCVLFLLPAESVSQHIKCSTPSPPFPYLPGSHLLVPLLCPYCRDVDIEQEINTSRGDIAYTVVDIGSIDIDPAGLQVGGRGRPASVGRGEGGERHWQHRHRPRWPAGGGRA